MWPFLFIAAGVAAAYAFARRNETAITSFDPKPGEQWLLDATIAPPFIGAENVDTTIALLNSNPEVQKIANIDNASLSADGSRMSMTITYHADTPLVKLGQTIKMPTGNVITFTGARKLN